MEALALGGEVFQPFLGEMLLVELLLQLAFLVKYLLLGALAVLVLVLDQPL